MALTFLGGSAAFAQVLEPSELDIYNEINIFSNAKYYPGVIEQTELLEKLYPQSVFIVSARIEKANALIILNRYEMAEETLAKVLSSIHIGNEAYAKCWYYLGRANYYDKDYISALNAFHTACEVENKENKKEFYYPSIFYSGRIYFFMEQYDKAIPLLEYVVQNGTNYTQDEYDEIIQKLCFSYNSTRQFDKTIKLFSDLPKERFSDKVYCALAIYAADAYEKKGQVEKAYAVLNSNDNPEFKEMLAEFRLNLGVAAYSKKDYDSASSYFKLASQSQNEDILLAVFIYEQKIALDTKGTSAAAGVRELLAQNQPRFENSTLEGALDSYNSLLLHCRAFELAGTKTLTVDKAAAFEIYELYQKIKAPGAGDAYTAGYLLSKTDTALAEKIVAPFSKDTDCAKLYASLLAKNGNYSQAATEYEKLNKKKALSSDERIEYAKVLYRLKKWQEAKTEALSVKHNLSAYIAGLCDFNLGSYSAAANYLKQYPKSKTAIFYRGLSLYKTAAYNDSYAVFSDYAKTYTERDSFRYRAYEYAAKSALMTSQIQKAAVMAQGMISAAMTPQQQQSSIIYCAEIYSDNKDYDSALKLLSIYTKDTDDFAVQCLMTSAKIYEKKGDLNNADQTYQTIVKRFAGTQAAEDASYRSGEVYYSAGKYAEAEARFTNYIYSFVNGKYSDAAYYFSGDCNMKLQKYDPAIMQNNTLVSKYPDSIYSYGAYKNLLQAYYAQEDYTNALITARLLVQKFKSQAESDGMGQRIVELERIVGGDDRTIVEKTTAYERNGKTSTKKGRNTGSELVQLYIQKGNQKEAFELAKELLNYQKDSDEMTFAAQNAECVAVYYHDRGQNQQAAEYYLKAAEYYRAGGTGNADNAASVLYSAVDAFVAAGMTGDARVTANLLVELYPDTKQGKKVMNLLK